LAFFRCSLSTTERGTRLAWLDGPRGADIEVGKIEHHTMRLGQKPWNVTQKRRGLMANESQLQGAVPD